MDRLEGHMNRLEGRMDRLAVRMDRLLYFMLAVMGGLVVSIVISLVS